MSSQLDASLLARLTAVGHGSHDLARKCSLLDTLRRQAPEASPQLDRFLLSEVSRLQEGLLEARSGLEGLRKLHEKLTAPPWHMGWFVRATPDGQKALVSCRGSLQIVNLADDAAAQALATGDEVCLSHDMNVLIGKSPSPSLLGGETATFQRYVADGLLALRWRDEELLAEAAAALRGVALEEGDLVRFDRTNYLAFEKIDRPPSQRHLVRETLEVGVGHVGGQRSALDALLSALTTALIAPERAAAYGLSGRRSVLLVGPPGCGKTLMARVAAAEVARLGGAKCHFAVVKPAEWEDPFVGATQRNIRECFESMKRMAGESQFGVLFLDEVEAVGRIRGGLVGHHSDKFLAALLAEIDGFGARGRVAIVAATNRKDLLDPALLERLSDVEVHVPRPDLRGAREIFDIHLDARLPFCPNGKEAPETRRELIERAVSLLFDPNADNELCTIQLRDGKTRVVAARELISGRWIEQICSAARQAAFLREVRSGDPGIRGEDIDEAVADAIERLASTLSPRNAHAYLSDLPQDIDVVSVEPIVRRTRRKHRYLNHRR